MEAKAVAQNCFVKKVFLEILQNSQENTCLRVSFLWWPITATAKTKRNTVNKGILISKVLFTYKKGLLSNKKDLLTKKKDFLTQKKGLLTYTKQTHGK